MMEKIAGWKWAVTCDSEDPSKLSVMICHDHHAFWPLATWNVHPTWLGMAVARSWAMTFLRGHHHNRSQPPRCNPAMVWGKEAEGRCCADLWWQMLANVGNRCWLKSMPWHTKMIQNADVKPLEKPTRDSGLSLGRAQKTIRFERLAGTAAVDPFF